MTDVKKIKKKSILVAALVAAGILLYVFVVGTIAGDKVWQTPEHSENYTVTGWFDEIIPGVVVEQNLQQAYCSIEEISLLVCTFGRENTCTIDVRLLQNEQAVFEKRLSAQGMLNGTVVNIPVNTEVSPEEPVVLQITSEDAEPGNAITLYYTNQMAVARGSIEAHPEEAERVRVNAEAYDGKLCFGITGWTNSIAGSILKYLLVVCGVLFAVYLLYNIYRYKQGKSTLLLHLIFILQSYGFLLNQLVSRDFKAKYKRSALGIIWSFANPLLTMLVQYFVFSGLFSSGIENYIIFLFTGTVFYGFFSESTSYILSSIVGNTALISKVYIPKYIFPVSRLLSTGINFGISMCLLLFILILNGTPLTINILFVPIAIVCMMVFCLGVGFFLCSVMVFFRDVQFIYGVLVTLIMYMTPIFYSADALSASIQWVFKVNPLYYLITFVRTCLIDFAYPGAENVLCCLLFAGVSLGLGLLFFKKTENNFTFYL